MHAPDDTLSPARTIQAAQDGAVTAWWQLTSIVRLSGADMLEFLENVSTQHIASVPVGDGRHTLFLDRKAKILAPAVAWRTGEDELLLELQRQHVEPLIRHLSMYRLRADVAIEQAEVAVAHVVGPNTPGVLHAVSALEPVGYAAWFASPVWGSVGLDYDLPAAGRELSLVEGMPSAAVIGDAEAVRAIVGELPTLGAPYADPEALDALRIELGVPFLNDFADGYMPAEVGADSLAVSFDKGCYLGQEPVARLQFRGKPNRGLRRVELSAPPPPGLDPSADDYLALHPHGAPDARAQGQLTSWATHPDGRVLGLAVVRNSVAADDVLTLAGTSTSVTAAPTPPLVTR